MPASRSRFVWGPTDLEWSTPCPIRGHAHQLRVVRSHVQVGTGKKATTVECPTGRYRWFVLEGRPLSDHTRMVRPRFGWKASQ